LRTNRRKPSGTANFGRNISLADSLGSSPNAPTKLRPCSSVRRLNGVKVVCEANTRNLSVGSHCRATGYYREVGRSILPTGTNFKARTMSAVQVGRKDAMEGREVKLLSAHTDGGRYRLSNCIEYKI
jgi:hypothetical protein